MMGLCSRWYKAFSFEFFQERYGPALASLHRYGLCCRLHFVHEEIADRQRLAVLAWIMQNSPAEKLRPFRLTTTQEIHQEDKEFVLKIMKLDPRDRPTAGPAPGR
ncbi:hypothetical protein CISG_05733 [Coccidioides immitis RMSCC 3703]|uniref:Uncharacterized protein n=1 Tax=Coccidioides immitis RMSCC 3703 TaxID=454286 RepID=A0A0J8QX56_COCIT|nr:hypothetical protein CISG_05733 [Coccidioides immitis RMSCC 3703]